MFNNTISALAFNINGVNNIVNSNGNVFIDVVNGIISKKVKNLS